MFIIYVGIKCGRKTNNIGGKESIFHSDEYKGVKNGHTK